MNARTAENEKARNDGDGHRPGLFDSRCARLPLEQQIAPCYSRVKSFFACTPLARRSHPASESWDLSCEYGSSLSSRPYCRVARCALHSVASSLLGPCGLCNQSIRQRENLNQRLPPAEPLEIGRIIRCHAIEKPCFGLADQHVDLLLHMRPEFALCPVSHDLRNTHHLFLDIHASGRKTIGHRRQSKIRRSTWVHYTIPYGPCGVIPASAGVAGLIPVACCIATGLGGACKAPWPFPPCPPSDCWNCVAICACIRTRWTASFTRRKYAPNSATCCWFRRPNASDCINRSNFSACSSMGSTGFTLIGA